MNLRFWGCLMAQQRHGGKNTWQLTSWSSSRRQRELAKNGWAFETSKSLPPSDIPLPIIPQFLVLPRQFHHLGTKYSNRCLWRSFSFKPAQWPWPGGWCVVPDSIKSVDESREWESVWVDSVRHSIFTSKLRLWTWPIWPFAWPALSHFSPLKDVGLHVPMLWEIVINSLKNSGERRSKSPFLHKNTDIVNNRTLTVKLRESFAVDMKVRAAKHMLTQEKVIWIWWASFVTVATTFLITVTKCPSSRVVLMHCSGDTAQPTRAVSAGQASAWCPWMLMPHITGNHEAESARCYYPDGLFPFPSYLDWDPRTRDGATYIQNRSSPSVDSLWKDSVRHTKDIWLQLTWQI